MGVFIADLVFSVRLFLSERNKAREGSYSPQGDPRVTVDNKY